MEINQEFSRITVTSILSLLWFLHLVELPVLGIMRLEIQGVLYPPGRYKHKHIMYGTLVYQCKEIVEGVRRRKDEMEASNYKYGDVGLQVLRIPLAVDPKTRGLTSYL